MSSPPPSCGAACARCPTTRASPTPSGARTRTRSSPSARTSSSRPWPSAWASTARTFATSCTRACRSRSSTTSRRRDGRAATACRPSACCCGAARTTGSGSPSSKARRRWRRARVRKLGQMLAFCQDVACRHRALLTYFGEKVTSGSCEACDVCLGEVAAADDGPQIAARILVGRGGAARAVRRHAPRRRAHRRRDREDPGDAPRPPRLLRRALRCVEVRGAHVDRSAHRAGVARALRRRVPDGHADGGRRPRPPWRGACGAAQPCVTAAADARVVERSWRDAGRA